MEQIVTIVDEDTGEVHELACPPGTVDILDNYADRLDDGRYIMPINEINFWRDAIGRLAQIDETVEMLADRLGWDTVEDVLNRVHARAGGDLSAWISLAEHLLRELEEGGLK